MNFLLLDVGGRGQDVLGGNQSARSDVGLSSILRGADQQMSVVVGASLGSVVSTDDPSRADRIHGRQTSNEQ